MTHHEIALAGFAALLASAACPAIAQTGSGQTLTFVTETQQFDKGQGSLQTLSLEYKLKADKTTILVTPVVGWRENPALRESALGGSLTLYQDWTESLSTRTHAFVAQSKSPFAHVDLAQDVTVKAAKSTAVTLGGRYARYSGGQEVAFASVGARQYFRGGSIAYRLSWTKPNTRGAFLSHLGSLTLSDKKGDGKTQLWISYGAASLATSQLPDTFRGKDYGAAVKRAQPLGKRFALHISAGFTSYDRPAARLTGVSAGLGLSFKM